MCLCLHCNIVLLFFDEPIDLASVVSALLLLGFSLLDHLVLHLLNTLLKLTLVISILCIQSLRVFGHLILQRSLLLFIFGLIIGTDLDLILDELGGVFSLAQAKLIFEHLDPLIFHRL